MNDSRQKPQHKTAVKHRTHSQPSEGDQTAEQTTGGVAMTSAEIIDKPVSSDEIGKAGDRKSVV